MEFTDAAFSSQMRPITGSAIREIFHLLGRPGMISFAGGNPSLAALEPDVVAELAQSALKKHGASLIQYGPTEGFAPLRESVAQFVGSAGVKATPAQVLPTQGSQQAMDLILRAMIEPGDVILVENPTFLGVIQAMRIAGARLVAVPTDGKGVIVEAAEEAMIWHRPKLMYVIPTFQNPTGITLAAERRAPLAKLAAKHGVLLIEDDPYRDLRYAGDAIPAIKAFDEAGWVAYLTSFSKLIAPGLRVGAAVADETLIRKLTIAKQSADVHSPLLTQAIVDGYFRNGLLAPHIRRVLGGYREQLNAMLEGFAGFPAGVTHTTPQGGLFVWASLPAGADALAMLKAAVERGVAYVPGTHFHIDGGHLNTLRLNFSNSPVADIRRGMAALAEVAGQFV
ncbi:MAG: PLP-dependent aminotransferase family protein [Clostridiales bacterium]|nr:PLP-dependent aminotransferase family protein [Clostridiales bacterium]